MFCDHILERFGDDGVMPIRYYTKEQFNKFCEDYKEEYIMNNIRANEMRALTLPL